MSELIAADDFKQAMDRIARSTDGGVLYRYLQKVRMGVTPLDAPERALPMNEGRRSFAADLMAFMAEGIADSDRYAVTFAVAKPAALGHAARGAGRRITADTRVDGWDTADTGPGNSTGSTN